MKIYYDDRACGAGKSYTERANIVAREGLYIWAVEQRKMMAEPFAKLREQAADVGRIPTIKAIYSRGEALDPILGDPVENVRAEIEALPQVYNRGHVIVIITHEALKAADLSGFEGRGWQLVLDETMSVWDQQDMQTTTMLGWLQDHYALEATEDKGLYRITSTTDETTRDLAQDTGGKAFAVMHQRILSDRTNVITDFGKWDDLKDNKEWTWSSMYDPSTLDVFDRVTMLANDVTKSVTYETSRARYPNVEWVNLNRKTTQTYARRKVVVHYYAVAHEARRSIFMTTQGKAFLHAVAADIDKRVGVQPHIWMCNEKDATSLRVNGSPMTGVKLSPRQSGIDKYGDHYHHASMIFTAKPGPKEQAVMEALGVSRDAIIATREHEVLVQFATRTSLRRSHSTETVHLTVYDEVQARKLEEYLTRTGYCDVELQLHRLVVGGVEMADWVKVEEQRGRPKVVLTDEEIKAKKQALADRKARNQAERRARLKAEKEFEKTE